MARTKSTGPKRVKVTYTGPGAFFPDLNRHVDAGDEIEVWEHQIPRRDLTVGSPPKPADKTDTPKTGEKE